MLNRATVNGNDQLVMGCLLWGIDPQAYRNFKLGFVHKKVGLLPFEGVFPVAIVDKLI
jgi:hypothetical protein